MLIEAPLRKNLSSIRTVIPSLIKNILIRIPEKHRGCFSWELPVLIQDYLLQLTTKTIMVIKQGENDFFANKIGLNFPEDMKTGHPLPSVQTTSNTLEL